MAAVEGAREDADSRIHLGYARHVAQARAPRDRGAGFGWVDYLFRNPKTGQIAPKSVYVEAVEGIILGCGIYKREETATRPAVARRPRLGYMPRVS